MSIKLTITRFEPRSSCIGSNSSVNCATTTVKVGTRAFFQFISSLPAFVSTIVRICSLGTSLQSLLFSSQKLKTDPCNCQRINLLFQHTNLLYQFALIFYVALVGNILNWLLPQLAPVLMCLAHWGNIKFRLENILQIFFQICLLRTEQQSMLILNITKIVFSRRTDIKN